MDRRILCVIFITVVTSYVETCSVDENECTFIVTCPGYGDESLSWTRFSPNDGVSLGESCEANYIQEIGYNIYPLKLVYKINSDILEEIPKLYNFMPSIVESLDISANGYTQTPILSSMPNLIKLNLSRNLLTTAVLSNVNKLNRLTEIDLSYNMINDIQVNNYEHPFIKLVEIDISHNYIVNIPDDVFDKFDDLKILDLSHNYIDTLSQLTFEGIKKLIDLNLSNNRLADINNSLFRFSELKNLSLSGNKIKDIKINDFGQLHKLEILDLSLNSIKTINFNMFDTMIRLQNLDLSNNQLEEINKNTSFNLHALHTINLSNNKFKYLPKGLFATATIYNFFITENKLEGLLENGMFEGVNVTKLDLSHQHFTGVQDYAFYNLNRLNILLLNSNNIQTLSNMCFKTLKKLKQLDLSNNLITNIDFNKEDLSSLQSMLLKNNRLTQIKHEHLQHLDSLEYLDLSGNQISQFEPKSFQSLGNLINLDICNNPLVGTLEADTFNGLISLPRLDVSQNMITLVQNASFKDMTKLTELNISSCEVSELQYNTFSQTGYIETLDLSHNKLKEFFVNTTELVGLTTLILNNNLIKTISPSSLNGLFQLNKVLLSHNVIENIHNESFTYLVDLRYLDLAYNEYLNFNFVILVNNTNLNTLILSGIKTHIKFIHNIEDSPITSLRLSNASIRNVSELCLRAVVHLDILDLSYNNVTKLNIGDFSGISTLRVLDLSFNKISFIQPGVFKDNMVLHSLNISHNSISSIGYGIFRGLMYLSILDISYNKIKDLESERFYEVKSLSQLIVDSNKIESVNAEEFVGTSLSKLSIGNNPLPCRILAKLTQNRVPYEITAIKLDEHSNENVNGVTCNIDSPSELTITRRSEKDIDNNDVLNRLLSNLYNFTNEHTKQRTNESQYLMNISNILEKSNSIYRNATNKFNQNLFYLTKLNNNSNTMLNKIVELLKQSLIVTSTPSPQPVTVAVTSTTTHVPLIENNPHLNQTEDVIHYMNKIKTELEKTIIILKQNVSNEIESRLALNNYHTESISDGIRHERLITSNEITKSLFTEICVGLILLILVGLVLYKFYKSRIFVRNRFSLSTRELPGAMENSAL